MSAPAVSNEHTKPSELPAVVRQSFPALLRAAQRARDVAERTGTALIVSRNGKVERLYPPFPPVLGSNANGDFSKLGAAATVEARMKTQDIVKQALELEPAARVAIAESILGSLDQPDPVIDALWLDEAERRLDAYHKGRVKGIPAEDVVGKL